MSFIPIYFWVLLVSWPILGVLASVLSCYLYEEAVTGGDLVFFAILGWFGILIAFLAFFQTHFKDKVLLDFTKRNK